MSFKLSILKWSAVMPDGPAQTPLLLSAFLRLGQQSEPMNTGEVFESLNQLGLVHIPAVRRPMKEQPRQEKKQLPSPFLPDCIRPENLFHRHSVYGMWDSLHHQCSPREHIRQIHNGPGCGDGWWGSYSPHDIPARPQTPPLRLGTDREWPSMGTSRSRPTTPTDPPNHRFAHQSDVSELHCT